MKKPLRQMIVGKSLEPLARQVHAAGAAHISNLEEKNRLYDMQTLAIMKRILQEDSNCVDIGCYQGSILREILRFAPKGTHFAFEPLPRMLPRLAECNVS